MRDDSAPEIGGHSADQTECYPPGNPGGQQHEVYWVYTGMLHGDHLRHEVMGSAHKLSAQMLYCAGTNPHKARPEGLINQPNPKHSTLLFCVQ